MASTSSPETPSRPTPTPTQGQRPSRVLPSFLASATQPPHEPGSPITRSFLPFPAMADEELEVIDGDLFAVPTVDTITRPSSPTPTDFSIISPDEYAHVNPDGPHSHQNGFLPQYQNSRYPYAYTYHYGQSRRSPWPFYSSPSLGSAFVGMGLTGRPEAPPPPQNQGSLRSIFPRIRDALSPARSPSPSVYPYGTTRPRFPHTSSSGSIFTSSRANQSTFSTMRYTPSPGPSPSRVSPKPSAPYTLSKGKETLSKGKARLLACHKALSSDSASGYSSYYHIDTNIDCIDYASLPPLDGEEGELVDEACYVDSRAVTGVDILALLPTELAIYILALLAHTPSSLPPSTFTSTSRGAGNEGNDSSYGNLQSILACTLVSHTWNRLANDNAVWRSLFESMSGNGWSIDLSRAPTVAQSVRSPCHSGDPRVRSVFDALRVDGERLKRFPPSPCLSTFSRMNTVSPAAAPLLLRWRKLFQDRWELDRRWEGNQRTSGQHNGSSPVETPNHKPKVMNLSGHTDSVYCLEFDAHRIVTGSRDRTIKVWCVKTGKLLGTISGHSGSVLCLKFDLGAEVCGSQDDAGVRSTVDYKDGWQRGFMVSGSSDCSVCVWDLFVRPPVDKVGSYFPSSDFGGYGGRGVVDEAAEELIHGSIYVRSTPGTPNDDNAQVKAEVKATLKGHTGGVLDIRINKDWIVSCSKDAMIKVWKRSTLEHYQTLSGHEGPVNAVGLQGERVVSASGDGKMILWDLQSGERVRTFEGHDRGLACIEFKDDYIVSGSNDCKIKIWRASTGECLRTLAGHELLVRALSFDPRNGRLVSASYDRTVRVWEVGTGKMVREFRTIHSSHIFDVKFDISRIVSTSHDQKIVVLDFSHDLDTSLFS
ncbi:hypothetical protein CCMSSC00406_0006119 [Pleurotus cornucopiae]|uniref:Uncharacterized protein n=1 Tax=Pleurotus cornucopiae TaxID=5321 RepID=A0ACB7JBI6_PLECO|nr:hypothetical protein CCMSSC00406_0006119 [Pleurotus cornucopiae]